MSVESWAQGQNNQRQRTIIASGEANPQVSPDLFAEPGGPATPAKAAGTPPDASNKPHTKPGASSKPTAKEPPVSTPKSRGE
jgi:hypothetical protein